MVATIESGFIAAKEESCWSPLYFLLAILFQLLGIAGILVLVLVDDLSSTEKWIVVGSAITAIGLAALMAGAGVTEAEKEAIRNARKTACC